MIAFLLLPPTDSVGGLRFIRKGGAGTERFLYYRASENGAEVKEILRREFDLSSSLLSALKRRADGITVNGAPVTVRYRLQNGDVLRLAVGDGDADSGFAEWDAPLEILYEDADLIVLNKPAFMAVHPSAGHGTDTLANCLTAYYHKKGERFVCRCVTRLDRNTSGAVLFAKNAYAHEGLRRQLADGAVEKTYLALVRGTPPFAGTVDAPVYRASGDGLRRTVDARGQRAVTDYRLLRSDGTLSLLQVSPRTGRTHQIRLHCAHLGCPVVSDFLYGDETDGVLSRHGLHCERLTFFHPVTRKRVTVKAPLAEDMARVAQALPETRRWYALDSYLKETYGETWMRLPLSGGVSCPNRENGGRGCTFCSAGGSGEFAPDAALSVPEQMRLQKERAKKADGYIAYFQSFTATYAPVDQLRARFTQAIEDPDVRALSVATRPDCLPEAVSDLLCELNWIKPVWVELGLQTASDETALRIRRGYPTEVYRRTAEDLRRRGLSVITHLIFGLPGEDRAQMLASARCAGEYGDGVKLQMLQILKGSVLGEEYLRRPFPLLTREEYADLVCDALAILPPRTVIHRLTGDPPADLLIAPNWTADKKKVLAQIARTMERKNLWQGKNEPSDGA